MIPDLPWLLFAVALLTGGLVKGALGVGLPLVAVPLLSLGMPPHLAIALLVVPVLASNFWQAVEGGRLVPSLQRFGGLIAAQFLATVLTVRMTLALSASQLSAMLAGAVLLAVALMAWKPTLQISASRERAVGVGVGLLSGLLGGVSSLTGPVIITYLMALRLRRDEFVGSIIDSEVFKLNFLIMPSSDSDGNNRHEIAVARCAARKARAGHSTAQYGPDFRANCGADRAEPHRRVQYLQAPRCAWRQGPARCTQRAADRRRAVA